MKVFVIGSGGREHALVWKLKRSKKVDKIFCAPGNAGIGQIAKCVNIQADNIKALGDFANRNKIGLTVVGPEVPLTKGIVDEFQRRRLKIFGPNKQASQLEGSKVFAKEFMRKYHIPTAAFKVFTVAAEAIGFCHSVDFPVIIKADGLAAGKGVVVAKNLKQATTTIEEMMIRHRFGRAGNKIVIESFLKGEEVSVMAITDGKAIIPFLSSQDHKQAYDGDRGPNTGGMGAYCPTRILDDYLVDQIRDYILQPTMTGLHKESITYKGVLYVGLMITESGPKVLEFNCRFGDPETQAVLPLLKTDLLDLMLASVNQKLGSGRKIEWSQKEAACVVMASKGYPGKYRTGLKITGLHNIGDNNCHIFHAGTVPKGNHLMTNGGRVLGVVGIDKNLQQALNRAYRAINKIRFEGAIYRRDIGFRALNKTREQV
ncbi:MAG: phosphoribosylamine--glycine ligase [candidate division Zixibacteria bacterium]|nr:phosphoribosylamine--glycine ligase [candidate division Zixibacteria bacterium]